MKSYGAKGQDVVDKNYAAIDRGGEYKKFEVKAEWANLADDAEKQDDAPAFVKELVRPINALAGDLLKVSDFVKHGTVDGSWEVKCQSWVKIPPLLSLLAFREARCLPMSVAAVRSCPLGIA